jgi:hypothetical protein
MVQPYNYTIQAPSAFEQLVSGLKLGASVQEMQAAAQQRQMQMEQLRAQQEQQARQRQLMDDVIGGRANRGTWLEIGMMGSSEAQRKGAWDQVANMDQQAVRSQIGFGSQLAFALKKNPAVAKQMLEDALRANPNDEFLKRINQLSETDTDFAAQTALLALPGLGKDGLDAYKETVNRLFPEATPLSPEAQREAVAKADKAVADAEAAQATARTAEEKAAADLRRSQAEAQKAEVQARVQAAEEKLAGGIELTPELRTAIGATKLAPDQKQALLDLAAAKAPKTALTVQSQSEAGAYGEALSDRFTEIRKQADLANSQLANLDVAQRILDDGFKTGFGTEWKAAASSVLSSLGVKNAERFATNAQVFLAQSRSALLTKQLEQKGPQTENDAKRIDQTFASLGNTLEANKFLIAHARAMALRNRELVTFWQKYRRENGTFDGAQEAYEDGPGAKSIFDYAPLKPFARIVSERAVESAPMPVITPPAAQTAPTTPATAPARRSIDDLLNQYRSR